MMSWWIGIILTIISCIVCASIMTILVVGLSELYIYISERRKRADGKRNENRN